MKTFSTELMAIFLTFPSPARLVTIMQLVFNCNSYITQMRQKPRAWRDFQRLTFFPEEGKIGIISREVNDEICCDL